jgi:glycosyltransferase involved in cell wall biosynthesis
MLFEIWDEEFLFRTVDEAVGLIRNGKYESEKYRAIIENRYSLEKQINHIKKLIEELASYRELMNYVADILSGKKRAEEFMADNLTVLIPCYNRAEMLKADLDKGLKLGNQEKLIVDDCSTYYLDALADIEKECKRYNSQLIRKNKNEGAAQTRWTGLQNIKTPFTAILDDDDMLLCLDREKAANDISKLNNDCILVMPRYVLNYNGDSLAIGYDRETYNNLTAGEVLTIIASTGEFSVMFGGGSITNTEVLRTYSSLKEFQIAEDFVILARIFANNRSKKVYTTDSLVHVRRISSQSLSKALTPLKLALALMAQAVACYYCLQLGVAGKEDVLEWMRNRAALLQRLYNFGESFETELIAYIAGEISEEIFVRFLALHGLELENGLDQLAPELRKMRAMFYNEPGPQKIFANAKADELPQVSIIIPTFNRKDMLKRNIDHALKQDYPNVEIIVSDDCSADGTDEMVMKEYMNEKKVKYYRNEKNIGQTLNCQKAFYSLAKGKYCLFVNDDDYLIDPLYISKAVKALEDNSDAAFAFSGYYYNNEVINRAFRVLPDYPEIIDGLDFFLLTF